MLGYVVPGRGSGSSFSTDRVRAWTARSSSGRSSSTVACKIACAVSKYRWARWSRSGRSAATGSTAAWPADRPAVPEQPRRSPAGGCGRRRRSARRTGRPLQVRADRVDRRLDIGQPLVPPARGRIAVLPRLTIATRPNAAWESLLIATPHRNARPGYSPKAARMSSLVLPAIRAAADRPAAS
jgi:hypothetical protein